MTIPTLTATAIDGDHDVLWGTKYAKRQHFPGRDGYLCQGMGKGWPDAMYDNDNGIY